MASVLMVEVERDNVSAGLEFFCNIFDGENPLSPCGIPYLFFTLYQNTLSDSERIRIIQDINHHVGQYQLTRLYGLTNIDTLVTLKQNVKVTLCKLLLNIRTHHSSSNMFVQVEKESDPNSILCAIDFDQYEVVMANINNISLYICQCIIEEEIPKVFINPDCSILVPQRIISKNRGFAKPKAIPLKIQEHTSVALKKLIKVAKRVSPSSSVSSHSSPSTATSSTTSMSTGLSYSSATRP
jgi:hypothetical protein